MSTNTTNTNDGSGNGASRPKKDPLTAPSSRAGEGARQYPFGTFALPDPATIERLANEFFKAMPRDFGNGDGFAEAASPEASSEEIPVTMFEEVLPARETSVFGATGYPAASPPVYTQPGPLTEEDLHAIAAALTESTALIPGAQGTASTPPMPGATPELPAETTISPLSVAPVLPPASEMVSFPGIPATPSSPPTGSPSGATMTAVPQSSAGAPSFPGSTPYAVEGEKGTPPGAAPVRSPGADWFSFPRVPAMPDLRGLETVQNPPAPSATPSTPPPNIAGSTEIPAAGKELHGPTPHTPVISAHQEKVPGSPSGIGIPDDPVAPSSLPSFNDLYSFPRVPGVQAAPNIPIPPPSSTPPPIPEGDLSIAVPPSTTDVASRQAESVMAAPGNGVLKSPGATSGAEVFEFRPDVEPAELGIAKRPLDAKLIRRDFPILEERVHGRPLVWLDNAATTQKPNAVIDRVTQFYRHENSNIHRAAHELAARATDAYEGAREKTRRFLNASSTREVVFVRGATEAINLVAQSWGRRNVREGDEVVITWLEHHANIVPWQMLCSEKGARLRVAPVNDRGEVILEEYEKLLGPRTRIVAFTQVSNALGTVTPAREMIEIAHRYGALVLLDGAQAVSHMPIDVQTLNCDFYVFSGHKVFAPTGIGVLYGKQNLLDFMPPWQGGGNMIADVRFEKTTYQTSPARFEAGTGNIADAVGLGAALDYVDEVGRESIAAYEHELLNYGTRKLLTVPGLHLIGTALEKAGVLSFVLDDVRTEDVGVALNQEGIAVRASHHCAQPILRRMGVESAVRPSLALYNTCEDIDALVAALLRLQAGRGHRRL
jgi:cysteine desulfurase / selenocysteine lyase